MIVRILGEGQFDLPEEDMDTLNALDDRLTEAIDSGDEGTFRTALQELLAAVRRNALPHDPDSLDPSDLVLPGPDSSLQDVKDLLGEEGLIPG